MKVPTLLTSGLLALALAGCSSPDTSTAPETTPEPQSTQAPSKQTASAEKPSAEGLSLKSEQKGITPVTLEIPAIDVKTKIENVGELANGQMGVPEGVDNVGWFEPGTLPGNQGSAVMAGHIDSLTGPAVFYKLDKLKKDDEIIVQDKDGKSLTFVVTKTKTYPRKEAPVEEIFGFSYGSRLNLITCTGEFNRKAKTHEERLVVYTELASDAASD
ncbi:class F sortase [Sporosarcina aquimarina]|uniref:Class F sortase n=1 Tax=Sporosarcina aquimarina TaxID=114975 RepID=A0ABU4G103_9BACL|nr:class F sortase [Sporosarcina aquimarina]MDW0110644.1 class F sortase [Sporosarcina aquimarina]